MRRVTSFELRTIGRAFLLLALMGSSGLAQTAPDATARGPLATTSAEYKLPATLDLDISGRTTELWARVYMPATLSSPPYPLLVFLHGNHATCGSGQNPRIDTSVTYTFHGICSATAPIVVPNHEGYGYLADQLASWGYIVVSINANRGINAAPGTPEDLGNNLARGRLVLKHLQLLSEWNVFGGSPTFLGVELKGALDFTQVGLFGHSRGGEGVRAAYSFYTTGDTRVNWAQQIPNPITFRGIFEIGPVDGQTSLLFTPVNIKWNVLLPMCDGDVSNLQGVRPFDRTFATHSDRNQKSTFAVWGANHNFYNTEWQTSESAGCAGHGNSPLFPATIGSPQQRQTALASVMAFFRANVGPGANAVFNQIFDPQLGLPAVVTTVTRVDRGYTDGSGATVLFEDFTQSTGTNTYGFANDAIDITVDHITNAIPNHNVVDAYGRRNNLRAATISWTAPGGSFQTNWAPPGLGQDIGQLKTLDFRVSRQCTPPSGTSCPAPSSLNPTEPSNFSLRLVAGDGSVSDPLYVDNYTDLRGPVGTSVNNLHSFLHPILQTVRIPLADFRGVDLSRIRGIRFTFDGTATGAIYLSDIRISSLTQKASSAIQLTSIASPSVQERPALALVNMDDVNVIKSVSIVQSTVEIEVETNREFTVHDELFVMRIGDQESTLSRYPESGDTHTLIFTFPSRILELVGQPVIVQMGSTPSSQDWFFGPLPNVTGK
jgi:hypothetical protein